MVGGLVMRARLNRTWRPVASVVAVLLVLMAVSAIAQTIPPKYERPPKAILDVLNVPITPQISVSPTRDVALLYTPVLYPPISQLAQPMLRLAGVRINPNNNAQHNPPRFVNFVLKRIADGREIKIAAPPDAYLSAPLWSPDGSRFAFTNTTRTAVDLWVGDAKSGAAHAVPGVKLNLALGAPCEWMPDSRTVLCRTVPVGRGAPPKESPVPAGPRIKESFGRAAPVPTYEDLLQSSLDEDLFDYYAASQLVLVDTATGRAARIGQPAIFGTASPAPGGRHILVARIHRPYSYLVPWSDFPREVEAWDRTGRVIYKVASLPLEENVPINGVPVGPRNITWQPTATATLVWVEALDDGNPKKQVPQRDRVMWLELATLKRGGSAKPAELARTEYRFAGLGWGERGDFAILRDSDWASARRRAWFFDPRDSATQPRLVWDLKRDDRYHDPGAPVIRTLPTGLRAVLQDGDFIYLLGQGASPEGDRPFLDRFDVKTLGPSGCSVLTRKATRRSKRCLPPTARSS